METTGVLQMNMFFGKKDGVFHLDDGLRTHFFQTQSFTAAVKRRQQTSSAAAVRRPEREGGDAIALQDEVVGLRKAINSLTQVQFDQ